VFVPVTASTAKVDALRGYPIDLWLSGSSPLWVGLVLLSLIPGLDDALDAVEVHSMTRPTKASTRAADRDEIDTRVRALLPVIDPAS
jgi:hypothetical protein